jgi:hypothetical protein
MVTRKEDCLDTKSGQVRLVIAMRNEAVVEDVERKLWLLLRERRVCLNIKDTADGPSLSTVFNPSLGLPKLSEKVRFEADTGPIAKYWFTETDYLAYQEAMKKRWEELRVNPLFRVVERVHEGGVMVSERVALKPASLKEVIRLHPYRPLATRPDLFTSTAPNHGRWYERFWQRLEPFGWVTLPEDPRKKPK